MAKLEHLPLILLLEFNREAKAEEAARNFSAVDGDNAIGEIAQQEKGFLILKRVVLTLIIGLLHVRGLMKIV